MRYTACSYLGPLAVAAICAAQTTKPAESATPPDSPREAVKSLVKAMSAGDAATMRDLLYAQDPTQKRLITAMTDTAVATAELNHAMAAKFGIEQARAVLTDPSQEVKTAIANIDKADEQIAGDTAKLSMARGSQSTMSLKKIDGKWRVDVAAYTNGASPEQVNQILSSVERGVLVYRESLADINAGKFKTAKEAGEALRSKISPRAGQKSQ